MKFGFRGWDFLPEVGVDGIIIIDKPKGLTSHDVVPKVRQKIGQQKVGHAGILDPIATGILVLALGKTTKLVPKLTNQDKEYEATLTIGIKTDTGDITGKILEQRKVGNIDISKIKTVFSKFQGQFLQIPPMISAKKYKGRPLYKYARQGKIIPRTPKQIYIYKLELNNIKLPEISFKVHCSKGTYVRTLCEDIGENLDTCACTSQIRRTKSGTFTIEQAISLEKFLNLDLKEIEEKTKELQEVT